jgi:hypothetical protein
VTIGGHRCVVRGREGERGARRCLRGGREAQQGFEASWFRQRMQQKREREDVSPMRYVQKREVMGES